MMKKKHHSSKPHYSMGNSVGGSEKNTNCGIPSGARRMDVSKMAGGMEFELKNDLFEAVEEQRTRDHAGMRKYVKPTH